MKVLLIRIDARLHPDCPREVPDAWLEPIRERIQRAHGCALKLLDMKGGLSPGELWAHAHGQRLLAAEIMGDSAIEWLKTWKGEVTK